MSDAAPLEDVLVVDMTRILAGPYASMWLGDLGAEIIKVEEPDSGDTSRGYGPPFVGEDSAYFMSVNRNKKSLTVDFTTDEGRRILRDLIEDADVLLENYRPGTLEKYDLDYESVRELNPEIVYTSLSGFGQDGPWSDKAGLDLTVQGLGGLMDLTGDPDGEPRRVGLAVSDLVSGIYAATGTVSALYHRRRTGEGQQVDVSLLDSMVSLLSYQASRYFATDEVPERMGNSHPSIAPYETFETEDGHLNLALVNDGLFESFCSLIGRESLANDERFENNASRVENREELHEILQEVFRRKTTEEWLEILDEADVPAGPVQDLEEVFEHPQVRARDMLRNLSEVGGPDFEQTGIPVKFSESPGDLQGPPPKLGEHTDEVLAERLGLSEQEIRQLREEGAIGPKPE